MPTRKAQNGSKRAGLPACKIIVEKHVDGYVAYPLGLNGVVVGQGDTYDAALKDAESAIRFHVANFGSAS